MAELFLFLASHGSNSEGRSCPRSWPLACVPSSSQVPCSSPRTCAHGWHQMTKQQGQVRSVAVGFLSAHPSHLMSTPKAKVEQHKSAKAPERNETQCWGLWDWACRGVEAATQRGHLGLREADRRVGRTAAAGSREAELRPGVHMSTLPCMSVHVCA